MVKLIDFGDYNIHFTFSLSIVGGKVCDWSFYHVSFMCVALLYPKAVKAVCLLRLETYILSSSVFEKVFISVVVLRFVFVALKGVKLFCLVKRSILIWIEYKWKIAAM